MGIWSRLRLADDLRNNFQNPGRIVEQLQFRAKHLYIHIKLERGHFPPISSFHIEDRAISLGPVTIFFKEMAQ